MRVLYLTCMEITKNNSIHQNQVFGLADKGVDYHFYFMTPMFILTRAGFSLNREKSNQDRNDTEESIIPILSLHGLMHLVIIPYYLLLTVPLLYRKQKKMEADIIHCRALLSVLTAVVTKKFFRMDYKIVCDPRSVYVEECVIHRAFRMNGLNYRGWKKLERWLYKNSDACIGLSEHFADYMRPSNPKSYYVPALVQDHLVYDQAMREFVRKEFELTDKDVVFIYIGSIGTWHSIELYIECLKKCQTKIPDGYRMRIILLTGNKRAIQELKDCFKEEMIMKTGQVPPSDIKKYLHVADYGIVPGSNLLGECYNLLYATMIASKAEEFLASGLPIIVNSRISSLAEMVKKNHAGFVFSNQDIDINYGTTFDRILISEHFNGEFRASSVVHNYQRIYQEILNR